MKINKIFSLLLVFGLILSGCQKNIEETDDEILRRDHIDINNTYEDPINTSKPEQSTFGYESDENTQTNNGFINNSYEEPMNTTTSFINDDNNQVGFIGDEEVEEDDE